LVTRIIRLASGEVTLLDEDDYERLKGYRYRKVSGGYAMRTIYAGGKETGRLLHRDILDVPEGMEVDHKDGDPLNNTKANLRVCTRSQNHANRKKPARRQGKTSRYRGVFFNRQPVTAKRPWWATIGKDRKQRYIGAFATEDEAARAYDRKALELFGEFASLNFPGEAY
jgi:hypothetical protein